jgi:hypothetical protein
MLDAVHLIGYDTVFWKLALLPVGRCEDGEGMDPAGMEN